MVCIECSSEPVDICDACNLEFGESGDDANGFNSTCVHCGENIFTTRCPECWVEIEEG